MQNFPRALMVALFMLLPAAAYAQGTIAGSVKDTSGAVLPGVTVEASSPALIEEAGTVVTDSAGQYKILDLRQGPTRSSLRCRLQDRAARRHHPGGQLHRAGERRPAGRRPRRDRSPSPAASPAVDVINNTPQFVAEPRCARCRFQSPSATRPPRALLHSRDDRHTVRARAVQHERPRLRDRRHGDRDRRPARQQPVRQRPVQRLLHERRERAGGHLHDRRRVGGNAERRPTHQQHRRKTAATSSRAPSSPTAQGSALQADNRSDAVKPFVTSRRHRLRLPGQPVVRRPAEKRQALVLFHLQVPGQQVLRPQLASSPTAVRHSGKRWATTARVGRLTWAASSRDKIRFYVEKQFNGEFYNGFNTSPTTSPEASTDAFGNGWVPQIKWTRAHSNRLLLEAGISYYNQPYEQNYKSTVGPRDLRHLEATTNRLTVAAGNTIPPYERDEDYSTVASASYVTGSHAIKTGMTNGWGTNSRTFTSTRRDQHACLRSTTRRCSGCPPSPLHAPRRAVQKVNSDLGMFVAGHVDA